MVQVPGDFAVKNSKVSLHFCLCNETENLDEPLNQGIAMFSSDEDQILGIKNGACTFEIRRNFTGGVFSAQIIQSLRSNEVHRRV